MRTIGKGENREKRNSLNNVGIVLSVLGGAIATLDSSIVLDYTSGRYGLVGLEVAILILAGAIIVY